MVTMDTRPDSGGNQDQPDDGRDANGHLPEPLDAAHWPPAADGPAIVLAGMALGQPVTQPTMSTSAPEEVPPVEPTSEPTSEPAPEPTPEPAAEPAPGGLTTKNTPTRAPRKATS